MALKQVKQFTGIYINPTICRICTVCKGWNWTQNEAAVSVCLCVCSCLQPYQISFPLFVLILCKKKKRKQCFRSNTENPFSYPEAVYLLRIKVSKNKANKSIKQLTGLQVRLSSSNFSPHISWWFRSKHLCPCSFVLFSLFTHSVSLSPPPSHLSLNPPRSPPLPSQHSTFTVKGEKNNTNCFLISASNKSLTNCRQSYSD